MSVFTVLMFGIGLASVVVDRMRGIIALFTLGFVAVIGVSRSRNW